MDNITTDIQKLYLLTGLYHALPLFATGNIYLQMLSVGFSNAVCLFVTGFWRGYSILLYMLQDLLLCLKEVLPTITGFFSHFFHFISPAEEFTCKCQFCGLFFLSSKAGGPPPKVNFFSDLLST